MNINKRIRPALIDPKVTNKLVRTLRKPDGEQWKPVKNFLQSFYSDWVEPHSLFFICLALFVIFLLYRYRTIQNQKYEAEMMREMGINDQTPKEKSDYDKLSLLILEAYKQQGHDRIEPLVKILPKHADRIRWYGYEESESDSTDKSSKKKRRKIPPAYRHLQNTLITGQGTNIQYGGQQSAPHTAPPAFAYPMYPYVGGTLLPSQAH